MIKSGSWFSYDGERIGQGRENVKKYLSENPEIMDEIEKKIRAKFNEAFEKSLGDEEPEEDEKIKMNNLDYVEEYDKLKTKVLKYIIYKKRTEKEIRQKFSKTIDEDILEDIIDELKENGYIDDLNYIDRAVNEFVALKNLSIREIKYKLFAKGLSNDIIDEYISSNFDELMKYEIKSAKNIIIKKQSMQEDEEIKQGLLKKGYIAENVKEAFNEVERD